MACYHPLQAYQSADGSVVFVERQGSDVVRSLLLPCGQCIGCRLERSRQWAIRCMHEASLYDKNCFITLTYDEGHLPFGDSLVYRDFQLFLKRVRRRFSSARIRFYMCGEYGEEFGRPHFHACLFNFDFPDKVYLRRGAKGSKLYTSKLLDELWGKGLCSVGDVTFESAAYVARYVMKKVTGFRSEEHYQVVDPLTGEVFERVREFNHMSLKPGIGAPWLLKFRSDVYPTGKCVVNGRLVKPPKYYDRLEALKDGVGFEWLQFERDVEARKHRDDNTDARLAVKEEVTKARVRFYQRKIA